MGSEFKLELEALLASQGQVFALHTGWEVFEEHYINFIHIRGPDASSSPLLLPSRDALDLVIFESLTTLGGTSAPPLSACPGHCTDPRDC